MNQPIGSTTNFEIKKEFNNVWDAYNDIIKELDAKVDYIYQTKDLISGRLDCYRTPYEIVIGAPQTMGERGLNISIYYDELPAPKELFNDLIKEIKQIIKEADNGAYDEERVRIFKKLLRNKKYYQLEENVELGICEKCGQECVLTDNNLCSECEIKL